MMRVARYAWFLVFILGITGLVWWQPWEERPVPFAEGLTATVEQGPLKKTVTATGLIQPRDFVDVGTQVSGLLKALYVEPGDVVKQGQLLAEIDPTVYQSKVAVDQAKLDNLRAQQAEQQAKLELAQAQYQRQKAMLTKTATSQDEWQVAETNLRVAQAQLAALAAQIRQVESELRGNEANLSYTRIIAPMAGMVVMKNAKQGQTLNANQQTPVIVRIADLSTMTVEAQVSEADVTQLKLNMPVYFSILGNTNQQWHSRLRQILPTPQIVNNVVLYYALFDVPNDNQQLRINMTAQVFFVVAEVADALLIPVSALSKGNQVQVINAQGQLETRAIKTGLSNRIKIQVLEGLALGEKVVIGQNNAQGKKTGSVYANPAKRLRL